MQQRVITYSNGTNLKLSLTPRQVAWFEAAGVWPRDEYGYYSNVWRGLSGGTPSLSDSAVGILLRGDETAGLVAR